MKILLFGKNGQVGWELQRSLSLLGEVVALDRSSKEYCGDLADLDGIAETVRRVRPGFIVNAAAYTAVDKAESDAEAAHLINAAAPGTLAEQAGVLNAWLVHYSTDYVFDGGGETARSEDAAVNPLGVYGASKLAGEQAIQASGCRHLILRTSWVYAARGANFAKTMLRLAKEREQLAVINDQIGAPTGAEFLADATAHALRTASGNPDVSGVYHLVAAGETSWYDYARWVIDFARAAGVEIKVKNEAIQPIPTSGYPTPARRPLNSRLATAKFSAAFGLQAPDWRFGVERMLTELLDK